MSAEVKLYKEERNIRTTQRWKKIARNFFLSTFLAFVEFVVVPKRRLNSEPEKINFYLEKSLSLCRASPKGHLRYEGWLDIAFFFCHPLDDAAVIELGTRSRLSLSAVLAISSERHKFCRCVSFTSTAVYNVVLSALNLCTGIASDTLWF